MKRHTGLAPRAEAWDWQLRAVCRDHGGESFFAPPAAESNRERTERQDQAEAVCAACPVAQTCLEHALTIGELYGIWGGLTPGERSHLPHRVRRKAAGTTPAATPRGQYSEG